MAHQYRTDPALRGLAAADDFYRTDDLLRQHGGASSSKIKDLTLLRTEFTTTFPIISFFIQCLANKLRGQSLIIESLKTDTLQL